MNFEELLRSRQQFENEMYDLLVNVELLVDPSFWEPVPVTFQIEKLTKITFEKETECFICFNEKHSFFELNCCKKFICEECSCSWFKGSVKCPFCNQDVRDFYD